MAAAARKAKPATPTRKVGPRSGLTRATFSIELEQLAALQAEAMKRAQERGSLKPDASEVVREAIASWMARRR
ncbi:MAG TPA: hypothetical protein VD838_20730 [Anaeromyxobacteraceae bacterium]|nr:hypothetical protein [Anaeromyxobacteraceae bacterium]